MSLTDTDVADLAREAVDSYDINLNVRIAPADPVDPYRWGAPAWTVTAGGRSSYVTAELSRSEALAKLVADLDPARPGGPADAKT